MKYEEFYDRAYPKMKEIEQYIISLLDIYQSEGEANCDLQPIIYICSRIKSPERMLEKLKRKGFSQTLDSALNEVYDAIGIRAVCAFAEDVYRLVDWLKAREEIIVLVEKDYYAHPKPNGYRSYHIIAKTIASTNEEFFVEIQIRTIASDFWATLEHRLKYKKDIPYEAVIREELERCALEINSVDASMQAIRDLLKK